MVEFSVWNRLPIPRYRFDLLRSDHHRAGNSTFGSSNFALLRFRNVDDTSFLCNILLFANLP